MVEFSPQGVSTSLSASGKGQTRAMNISQASLDMRVRLRVFVGVLMDSSWLLAAEINLCGFGKRMKTSSTTAQLCSMATLRMSRWSSGILDST